MDWFLYEEDLHYERVKSYLVFLTERRGRAYPWSYEVILNKQFF